MRRLFKNKTFRKMVFLVASGLAVGLPGAKHIKEVIDLVSNYVEHIYSQE